MIQEFEYPVSLDTKNTITNNGHHDDQDELFHENDPSYKELSARIDEWLPHTDGWFTSDDVDRQFNIRTTDGKRRRWQVLENRVGTVLEKRGNKYRLIDTRMDEIDWQNADTANSIELKWTFMLEQYIKIYPKSIIIVAGVSGSGKTAFIYDFILKNMYHPMGVVLFTNDMGPEEIFERLSKSGITIPQPAPFRIFERFDKFSDVIYPDMINIIDYLDLNTELYMIGQEIDDIAKKLQSGMALIAIQKKAENNLGIGGVFSLKRSKVYLTMNPGELTIEKSRSRADPRVNPKGKKVKFKLVDGIKFLVES